jgi:hypothetical protein
VTFFLPERRSSWKTPNAVILKLRGGENTSRRRRTSASPTTGGLRTDLTCFRDCSLYSNRFSHIRLFSQAIYPPGDCNPLRGLFIPASDAMNLNLHEYAGRKLISTIRAPYIRTLRGLHVTHRLVTLIVTLCVEVRYVTRRARL